MSASVWRRRLNRGSRPGGTDSAGTQPGAAHDPPHAMEVYAYKRLQSPRAWKEAQLWQGDLILRRPGTVGLLEAIARTGTLQHSCIRSN